MASSTVVEGLSRYEIGKKVRALRLRKKIGLVELGKHTGFSPALLSKIESSKIFPPLGTLYRIALVFGVGLDYFFADARSKPVVALVRKGERIRLGHGGVDPQRPAYFFESLDYPANNRPSSAYLAEFAPVDLDQAAPHEHVGFETIYLMTGRLAVTIEEEEHILAPGDSLYFDSSVPHTYRRIGNQVCRGIVVTVP